jgi:flagellar biogenesis protein FliO
MFAFADNILNIDKINKQIVATSTTSSISKSVGAGAGIQWLSFAIAISIIIVILFFLYRFIKFRKVKIQGDYLKVIDTISLDINNRISVVQIGGDYYLIGYNSNNIVKISDISDESLIENFKLNVNTTRKFKDIFLSKTTKNFTFQKAKDRLKNLK